MNLSKKDNTFNNKVIFCKRCVMSNQRPGSTIEFKSNKTEKKNLIKFNKDGICSACEYKDIKDKQIDWEERKKAGKWKNSPQYGTFKKGFIGLQDHDSPIWFRNIKVIILVIYKFLVGRFKKTDTFI